MARLELRFGVPVTDGEREYGSLEGTVLEEQTLRWSAAIVRRGIMRRSEGIVPRSAVIDATDERVVVTAPPAASVPTTTRVLRSDSQIQAGDGANLGRLVLLLATNDGLLLHLVVQRHLLGPYLMVPAARLAAVGPIGLLVDLPSEAVDALPAYRSDADLVSEVRSALADIKTLALYEDRYIRVSVTDGVVTLTGHVSSRVRANQVETAVETVPGVLAVENKLVCDDELAIEVAHALAEEPRTRARSLHVQANHGVVTLKGHAPDAETAEAATEIVAQVPTVRGIVNQIAAPHFVPDAGWAEPPVVGEAAYAEDGPVGSVDRVVIDPRKRRLAGIIVAARVPEDSKPDARFVERTLFVGVEQFRTVTEAGVFIHGRALDAARGPLAIKRTRPASERWRPPFPYQHDDVVWPAEVAEAVSAAVPASGS